MNKNKGKQPAYIAQAATGAEAAAQAQKALEDAQAAANEQARFLMGLPASMIDPNNSVYLSQLSTVQI